jgi:hypothetical protein
MRVIRRSGEQIGYLERNFAGEVVSRAAKGWRYHAVIAGIGRSGRGLHGVSLLLIVDGEDSSDDEVVAYARTVLSADRQREAPAPSATTATSPTTWLMVGALLAVALTIVAIVAAW